jgi:uncharacterized protein YciI
MKNKFVAISSAGPNRDTLKGTRELPFWNEHAEFIDKLVDEGGALLIVKAADENEVREKIKNDPWYEQGILKLESIRHWQIFIDMRQ